MCVNLITLDWYYLQNWDYSERIERYVWNYPILVYSTGKIEFLKVKFESLGSIYMYPFLFKLFYVKIEKEIQNENHEFIWYLPKIISCSLEYIWCKCKRNILRSETFVTENAKLSPAFMTAFEKFMFQK